MMSSSSLTSGGAIRWLAIVVAALLPGFLINPSAIVERLIPLTNDSIEFPRSIDLGSVQPNERRPIEVKYASRIPRRIALRPVQTDCGCFAINDGPRILEPYDDLTTLASIQVPAVPGQFTRSLLYMPEDIDNVAWKVVVQGRVVTDAWSEPSALSLELDDDRAAEANVTIHIANDYQIAAIVPTSEAIRVEVLHKQPDEVTYRVKVIGESNEFAEQGNESLQVYSDLDTQQPVLVIPVRWALRPRFAYVPSRLDFPSYSRSGKANGQISRVVAVILPTNQSVSDVQLSVLVPWAHVTAREFHSSALRVNLAFDCNEMPERFEEPILSAKLVSQPVGEELLASGYREQ